MERRTYRSLQQANIERQKEWDADDKLDAAFYGVEHAGEVGEALEQIAAQIEYALAAIDHGAVVGRVANIVKKRVREDRGIRGSRATLADLRAELADDVITAYLLAKKSGIDDLDAAIEEKFNATSEKMGLTVFLDLTSPYDISK